MIGRLVKLPFAHFVCRSGSRHLRILSCPNVYSLVRPKGYFGGISTGLKGLEIRSYSEAREISAHEFDTVCAETLESLCEFFEELVETAKELKGSDVVYQDGVLTVNLGKDFGVYVINRQTPNKQIWLSSPKSGPKRYDFRADSGSWVYKHDGVTLHHLLQKEFSDMIGERVDLSTCAHCGKLN